MDDEAAGGPCPLKWDMGEHESEVAADAEKLRTTTQIAELLFVTPALVRTWAGRGLLVAAARNEKNGRPLYRLKDALEAESHTRLTPNQRRHLRQGESMLTYHGAKRKGRRARPGLDLALANELRRGQFPEHYTAKACPARPGWLVYVTDVDRFTKAATFQSIPAAVRDLVRLLGKDPAPDQPVRVIRVETLN